MLSRDPFACVRKGLVASDIRRLTELSSRLALAVLSTFCSGCPDPNIYGTPRTTPVGKLSHTAAIQFASYSYDDTTRARSATGGTTMPLPPSYQLRVGVIDNLDIGFRFAHLTSLSTDVKWNFIKTELFDVAVDPSIQVGYYSSCSTDGGAHTEVYGHVPLLFGFNVTDSVSIVPTAGVSYGCASRGGLFGNSPSEDGNIRGVMARGGIGVEFRASPKFGLHPEVTFLRYVGSDSQPAISWVVFGIGLNFGALPH